LNGRYETVQIAMFDRWWRVRATLPERYGQKCRILKRGKMNSCMVEFEDGYRTITSRWSVRLIVAKPKRKSPTSSMSRHAARAGVPCAWL
jgi:hypothetical protein